MKVLATAQHAGGAEAIAPVIKELLQRGEEVVVIAHEYSKGVFKKDDILHKVWAERVSSHDMKALIISERPNLVLTGTFDRDNKFMENVLDQVAIFAAKEKKIPALAVLDSHVRVEDRFNYLGERTFQFLPDKIATEQSIVDIIKEKQCFDLELLEPTGNPSFDALPIIAEKFTEQQKWAVKTRLDFLNVDFLIFFAGTIFQAEFETLGYWDYPVVRIISDLLTNFELQGSKSIAAVVKLHPRMPQDEQDSISDCVMRRSGRVKIVKDFDAEDLILTSDLTTTTHSTVGVKAVHMGKLCLSLQPELKLKEDPFIPSAQGFVPVGYKKADCYKILRQMVVDSNYREKWIRKGSRFKTDGKATERVVALIYKMTRGK